MKPPPIKKSSKKKVSKKTFSIGKWSGDKTGEKIIIYGKSGIGKTTLSSLAPHPVFIGIDDGGRKIHHPKTGEELDRVEGVETYQDVRDALQQMGLYKNIDTIIIDTATKLEQLAEEHMYKNIPHEKGYKVNSIEGYGYGKGYRHLRETMLLLLQDFDRLVREGKNIVLLCQSAAGVRSNPAGDDFLEDGPRLYHSKTKEENSVKLAYCEWADHVVKLDYFNFKVTKDKKAVGLTERAIFVHPEVYFFAKSRTITEPVISFEKPNDDSFWRYLK